MPVILVTWEEGLWFQGSLGKKVKQLNENQKSSLIMTLMIYIALI
jgi:hypothetical protein